jgi:hypothetical protein
MMPWRRFARLRLRPGKNWENLSYDIYRGIDDDQELGGARETRDASRCGDGTPV